MRDTSATERLDGAVDDGEGDLRHGGLGFGDLLEGGLGAQVVHLDGGVEDEEAGGVDFDAGAGDPFEDYAVIFELFAEGGLSGVVDAHDHPLEGFLGLWVVFLGQSLDIPRLGNTYTKEKQGEKKEGQEGERM